ncbi:MAG TPA: DsbA family protein [Gemmatimonadaceae bacterium]|nr:DsbA family protein [Gemmatimonadaceae bacterium]
MLSQKKEFFVNTLVSLLTVGAMITLGLRVHAYFSKPKPASQSEPTHVADWKQYATVGTRIGAPHAPVVVTVFEDFQCPFCKSLASDLLAARQRRPSALAVVYRQYPLSSHFHSNGAARAALCAGRQGVFEQMHRKLYEEQDSIGHKAFLEFARESGVSDLGAFEKCLDDPKIQTEIKRDSLAGVRLGISGTPTLLINDLKLVGSPGGRLLDSYIDALIDGRHRSR